MRHAEPIDPVELTGQLCDAAYDEAMGVLTIISQTPEDRLFYEARQKFLRDEASRIKAART